MSRIPVLLLALLVCACTSTSQQPPQASPPAGSGSGTSVALTDAERAQVQSAVTTRLGNDQATFRTMLAQRDANGSVTVCGYVNQGTGDTPFVGSLSGQAFTVSDIGGPKERTIAVQQACHGRGIYL
jgi:hypothetical protein